MKIAIFRSSSSLLIEPKLLEATIAELLLSSYERTVSLKEAPAKTDCVTAIHYLIQKVFQITLPRAWIGDLPRELSQSHWTLHIIDSTELKTGDLLFLKHQKQTNLISHVAFVIGPDQIFHCTREFGPIIQSVKQVFERYEQPLKNDQIIYIDSRNTPLRNLHSGSYIKN